MAASVRRNKCRNLRFDVFHSSVVDAVGRVVFDVSKRRHALILRVKQSKKKKKSIFFF